MLVEQTCNLLVQLADLLFDQLQLLERHLHQPAVDRIESVHAPNASRSCVEVARKRWSAKSAKAAGLVSPSANACSIRRALAPSRSETKLDNLIWASSSSASS